MRKGERAILGVIAAFALGAMAWKGWQVTQTESEDFRIPFFSTASTEVESRASALIKQNACKDCHSLWATRNVMQAVPAPSLDGIGSLKDEAWLFDYLSAENPQSILPTRLKPEYRMPSFSHLSEEDRRVLARYLASLKVEDWYFSEVRKAEFEKLTGKEYRE